MSKDNQTVLLWCAVAYAVWAGLKIEYSKWMDRRVAPPPELREPEALEELPMPKKPERQKVIIEAVLCEQCKKPYIAKVEHQKYCSANCRIKANKK